MSEALKRGLVLRAVGSSYTVLCESELYTCGLRGRLRLSGSRSTNPVVVGDWVLFSAESLRIEEVEARRNAMVRRAVKLSAAQQILAANLDLAIIVYTAIYPPTPLEFVDRFLATARAYGIPSLLLHNKSDLAEEQAAWQDWAIEAIYRPAEVECLEISTLTGEGLETFRSHLLGKVVLIAGQSGVGKSSLLNAIEPGLAAKVAPLSAQFGLGVHTTTFSEMYALPSLPGSYLIDTPGIKGFGVVGFQKHEVAHFFPEIFARGRGCRYPNCLHELEPGCAVRKAYEEGELAESRYRSYLSLLYEEGAYR